MFDEGSVFLRNGTLWPKREHFLACARPTGKCIYFSGIRRKPRKDRSERNQKRKTKKKLNWYRVVFAVTVPWNFPSGHTANYHMHKQLFASLVSFESVPTVRLLSCSSLFCSLAVCACLCEQILWFHFERLVFALFRVLVCVCAVNVCREFIWQPPSNQLTWVFLQIIPLYQISRK